MAEFFERKRVKLLQDRVIHIMLNGGVVQSKDD